MKPIEYDIMFAVEETHWWYRAMRRLLLFQLDRYLPDWRHRPILDAGCGTGATLVHMGSMAAHIGLDLCEQALEFSRRRGLRRLVRGDISALPFADETVSAVISVNVLYHLWVTDIRHALRESHRVLHDGGLLFLTLPAFESLTSAHDVSVYTRKRFRSGEVRELLSSAGFEIHHITYWNTLLFPLIWLVRFFGILQAGTDFAQGRTPAGVKNTMLDLLMRFEFFLLRRFALPFGVSIACVAQKPA